VPYTLVAFHAHPDDESIAMGGTLARAKAEGHRVVLVVATKGELGEYDPAVLADGETLTERRVQEQMDSARVLGLDEVVFLGYHDSGMAGTETNDAPECFAQADLEEAAERLAKVLVAYEADVLTIYDDHGGYGHPDHMQVHRVGVRAAELAGTRRVYESTMNRDYIQGLMANAAEVMPDAMDAPDAPEAAQMDDFGSPEAIITTTVDVRDYTEAKRAAMAAHSSQIPADSFFLKMPPDVFQVAFGYEWFIRRDDPDRKGETWLFDDLD
jgi:LmbE family N-acetylglucosaminyl deacetylase